MTASWDPVFAVAFLALFAAIALYSLSVAEGSRGWWALLAALALLMVGGTAAARGLTRLLALDAASFAAAGMVWLRGSTEARRAARTYLGALILAALCIAAGLYLGGLLGGGGAVGGEIPSALARVVVGLLIAGFALKLALVPCYFWLPEVAQQASPMTVAVVISVVDIGAFCELAQIRVDAPRVFGGARWLWLAVALASMFGGALLALAQRDLRRMLAFSTIDDMGYLLLGLLVGPGLGLTGALLGALSHALLKVVLFGSLGLVERGTGRHVTLDSRGLMARYPVSGASFILAGLGMIGVPPLMGFVGRWRLYLAGLQYGGTALLAAMMAATGLALLYYVRASHRVWFGQPEQPVREPVGCHPEDGFRAKLSPRPGEAEGPAVPAPARAQAQASTAGGPASGSSDGPVARPSIAAEPRMAAACLATLLVLALVLGLFPGMLTGFLP